jgi:hypothetical protein
MNHNLEGFTMKRTLLVFMAVWMAVLTAPTLADTWGDYEYTATSAITGYTGPGGDVTIPDTINGLMVIEIVDHAFAQQYSITGITIPVSIVSIGENAFYPTGLTAITVVPANPAYSSLDGVLFNKNQTELIRYPDRKAGNYIIPNSVMAIGDWAFINCDDLTSIAIPDSVTAIGDSFLAMV